MKDGREGLATFQQRLRDAVEGEVRFDAASRAMYSSDASVYQILPAGVVLPRSPADVATAVNEALAAAGLGADVRALIVAVPDAADPSGIGFRVALTLDAVKSLSK